MEFSGGMHRDIDTDTDIEKYVDICIILGKTPELPQKNLVWCQLCDAARYSPVVLTSHTGACFCLESRLISLDPFPW